jgi:NitT/TauT family transport system substrate-binding protein
MKYNACEEGNDMRLTRKAIVACFMVGFSLSAVAQKETQIRYAHDWRFEGQSAPFFVALDKGYYKAEGLNVSIDAGSGSVEGINRVASGAYELGQADINSLIKYRDNPRNLPVKAVMMLYNAPPFAILTLKKNNIRTPKDLEGKVLGAPAADAAWQQWPIFVKVNRVDPGKVEVQNLGFPVRETMLAQGKVDAVTAFASNALGLRANGVPWEEIVVMMMSDFGVELYGNAIMANPDFMRFSPKAIAGFVRATVRGFQETIRDPDAAIESVMKRNPVAKRDIELERLKMVIRQSFITKEVRDNGLGAVDMKRLERSIDQISLTFQFSNKPKAANIFTSEYLPPREQRLVK